MAPRDSDGWRGRAVNFPDSEVETRVGVWWRSGKFPEPGPGLPADLTQARANLIAVARRAATVVRELRERVEALRGRTADRDLADSLADMAENQMDVAEAAVLAFDRIATVMGGGTAAEIARIAVDLCETAERLAKATDMVLR